MLDWGLRMRIPLEGQCYSEYFGGACCQDFLEKSVNQTVAGLLSQNSDETIITRTPDYLQCNYYAYHGNAIPSHLVRATEPSMKPAWDL